MDVARTLGRMSGGLSLAKEISNINLDRPAPEHIRQQWVQGLGQLQEDCIELDLSVSAISVRRILQLLSRPDTTYQQVHDAFVELQQRLIDEASGRVFLSLTPRETEYYENPTKNWEEVIARLPGTVGDIEESKKCFALGRYAAAVLHSMQIIEVGLVELGSFIGVTDPKSGWTAVTNALKTTLSKKFTDRTPFEQKNSDFLDQVLATTEALKNAWRNKISHAYGRLVLMTVDFSPEVAEEILIASRAFMRRLVTGLPPAAP